MSLTLLTDTYITLADARAYVAKFGLAPLPTVDADAEALLKRAASSLDRIYEPRYLGTRQFSTQPMAWLRDIYITRTPHYTGEENWVTVDSYGNPRDFSQVQPELGWAQTELATQIQSNTDIFAQPASAIKRSTNKVGTLEETLEYSTGVGFKEDNLYSITQILRPLLRNSTGAIPITRGA